MQSSLRESQKSATPPPPALQPPPLHSFMCTMPPERQLNSSADLLNNTVASSIPECSGCFCLIQERYYLLVMDRAWHMSCLRCVDCKSSLDSQHSCFTKDGFIYCKDDYFKLVKWDSNIYI